MPTPPADSAATRAAEVGRRRSPGRKGAVRERTILDVTEKLLRDQGFDAMTVDAIASGAGISRGSLYFYYGSKQEVLTALVGRTMRDIDARFAEASADRSDGPAGVIRSALRAVEWMWREHGVVMRAAVEMGPSVPAIGDLWRETVEASGRRFRVVLMEAGLPDGDGPEDALAVATALCLMAERSYFWSFAATGTTRLTEVTASCLRIWQATLEDARRRSDTTNPPSASSPR